MDQAMNDTQVDKTVVAYGLSFAIASILSALLVILKEKSASVGELLAAITGHHWVTHSLLYVIVFLVLGWALSKANGGNGIAMTAKSLLTSIIGSWVISGVIIVGFFLA